MWFGETVQENISANDDTNLCYIGVLNFKFTNAKSTSYTEVVKDPTVHIWMRQTCFQALTFRSKSFCDKSLRVNSLSQVGGRGLCRDLQDFREGWIELSLITAGICFNLF